MLAEDEPGLRSVVAQAPKMFGYDVLAAAELFIQHPSETICVLTDLTMPHMGGRETIQSVGALAPDVSVIRASGYEQSRGGPPG